MRAAIPNLDEVADRVLDALANLPAAPSAVINGDLFPGNILLDPHDQPVAILDFGFLSTVGDPDFDTAVSSELFDMYSPSAIATTRRFQAAAAEQLGLDASKASLYLAAYGLITATAYNSAGADGHFSWCVDRVREYAEHL